MAASLLSDLAVRPSAARVRQETLSLEKETWVIPNGLEHLEGSEDITTLSESVRITDVFQGPLAPLSLSQGASSSFCSFLPAHLPQAIRWHTS